MPLFDRLNRPAETGNSGEKRPEEPHLSPLLPGRSGRPSISLEALRERVESQFREETAGRDDILAELDTEESQRALLREVAEYVFAVEAVTPSPAEKQAILDKAYHNLFGFGPLDALLDDETVTEISITGPDEVRVRRGAGPLELTAVRFDGLAHLADVLRRALAATGQTLSDAVPVIEAGALLRGRPARVSAVGPPISALISATIRLHPSRPLVLDELAARGAFLPAQGVLLLRAILSAGHGLLIAGEAGAGKTTLAGALVRELCAGGARVAWAERAAELPLPADVRRFVPGAAGGESPPGDLADAMRAALATAPDWLVLDEARTDEAPALWEALSSEKTPHFLWTMRAPTRTDRLRSALTLMLYRAEPAIEPEVVNGAILRHLPFVVLLGRAENTLRLMTIGEWLSEADGLRLHPLLEWRGGAWALAPMETQRGLALPPDFWA